MNQKLRDFDMLEPELQKIVDQHQGDKRIKDQCVILNRIIIAKQHIQEHKEMMEKRVKELKKKK